MASRNRGSTIGLLPAVYGPRTKKKMQTVKRVQSQEHGKLTPFFLAVVYPYDTWQIDTNIYVKADTSAVVPLDDIWLDTYYFYVPFRILDENFKKVLGDNDDDYDDAPYSMPSITVDVDGAQDAEIVEHYCGNPLFYLNYNLKIDSSLSAANTDVINAYPLAALWKIWNHYFRDENLQSSVDITSIYGDTVSLSDPLSSASECFLMPIVNRFTDYFSTGLIAPQKGPTTTIPLGSLAPLTVGNQLYKFNSDAASNPLKIGLQGDSATTPVFTSSSLAISGNEANEGTVYFDTSISGTSAGRPAWTNLYADLSEATSASIDSLTLAFAIQSLYRTKARYGSRYEEYLYGMWGVRVPELMVSEPEYLGGERVSLNNVPVFNTSSDLGDIAGNSSTLFNDGGFVKSFLEYGLIIGVSCTRVRHTYSQGKDISIYDLHDELDLYNPQFANIGNTPKYKSEIVNFGNNGNFENKGLVFNYDQPYEYLRQLVSRNAGLFNPNIDVQDLNHMRDLWNYGDIYSVQPTFSDSWLREDKTNVSRTLTGTLIPNASGTSASLPSHQFMFAYYTHPTATRRLPEFAIPVDLGTRY